MTGSDIPIGIFEKRNKNRIWRGFNSILIIVALKKLEIHMPQISIFS